MKKIFTAYEKLMGVFYSLIRACIAISLVVMVVVTFIEVIRRYAFGLSFIWAEELVRFLLVFTAFLGVQGYSYSFSPQIANMYSTGLRLKMTVVYLSIPVGFTLLALFGVEHLFETLLPSAKEETED